MRPLFVVAIGAASFLVAGCGNSGPGKSPTGGQPITKENAPAQYVGKQMLYEEQNKAQAKEKMLESVPKSYPMPRGAGS